MVRSAAPADDSGHGRCRSIPRLDVVVAGSRTWLVTWGTLSAFLSSIRSLSSDYRRAGRLDKAYLAPEVRSLLLGWNAEGP